jgi:hypothetical protein
MKPIRINTVATDCTSLTFDKLDCHIQEREVTILLDNNEADGLCEGIFVARHMEGLAMQEATESLPFGEPTPREIVAAKVKAFCVRITRPLRYMANRKDEGGAWDFKREGEL